MAVTASSFLCQNFMDTLANSDVCMVYCDMVKSGCLSKPGGGKMLSAAPVAMPPPKTETPQASFPGEDAPLANVPATGGSDGI